MQFVDIFVAVCNLAETMLDPPDYELAAECRYMPEVYGGIFLSPSFNISLISIFTLESRHHGVRLRGRERAGERLRLLIRSGRFGGTDVSFGCQETVNIDTVITFIKFRSLYATLPSD